MLLEDISSVHTQLSGVKYCVLFLVFWFTLFSNLYYAALWWLTVLFAQKENVALLASMANKMCFYLLQVKYIYFTQYMMQLSLSLTSRI